MPTYVFKGRNRLNENRLSANALPTIARPCARSCAANK
jgi:hypothetical protein